MAITRDVRMGWAVDSARKTTRYQNICASARMERGVPELIDDYWRQMSAIHFG